MDEAVRRLAHVLGAANARPVSKPEFYCVKDYICRTIGEMVGFDYQLIKYDCWNCGGRGERFDGSECYRCDGTGVYDSAMVELARYRIGQRIFHQPRRKIAGLERNRRSVDISGLVKHETQSWSLCANIAIGRLFDHAYYWQCLHAVPADRFGLTVKQSENLCSWMMMGEWKAVRHSVPAAQHWLQQRGNRMSP